MIKNCQSIPNSLATTTVDCRLSANCEKPTRNALHILKLVGDSTISRALGVTGYPTTIFIDKTGTVIFRTIGKTADRTEPGKM